MAPMTGPRATAVWKAMTLPGGADYQVLADATDSQRWYYLPRRHRVVTTRGGSPELSLTLLLQQTPAPDAVDLRDLVRQGSVAMTVVNSCSPVAKQYSGFAFGAKRPTTRALLLSPL